MKGSTSLRGGPKLCAWRRLVCKLLLSLAFLHTPAWGDPSARAQAERNIEKYATRRVQPAYPQHAQKYRVEGVVTIQVVVGGDGKVARAEFVRGQNVFRSVALDAAKRWEFKLPDNNAEGTIRFVFKLGG